MKTQRGSSMMSVPIVIAIGMVFLSILMVTVVKIISPYIAYEKLSSICMKYVFVLEEYGYLTKQEGSKLLEDLEKQGFSKNKMEVSYTSKKVNYGDEIFLMIYYEYPLTLPMIGEKKVPMRVEKYSICKR